MRFKPDWPAPAHVTDVSVWPWRRLRKTSAAWGPRGFWEVESLFFFLKAKVFFFSFFLKKKMITWSLARVRGSRRRGCLLQRRS